MNTSSLIIRPNTSDSASFRQIFTEEELGPISLPFDSPSLILDCGAYVGYSSYYLLSKFPSSRVLAVEPDRDNFEILCCNLQPFIKTGRALELNVAVWSEMCRLSPSETAFRDGRNWSRTFEPSLQTSSSSYFGFPVEDLVCSLSKSRSIDLLKMDVEGAETLIFAGDVSWLDRINQIAIELHDDSPHGPATPIFLAAIKDRGFDLSKSGELTIARRKSITSNRSTK